MRSKPQMKTITMEEKQGIGVRTSYNLPMLLIVRVCLNKAGLNQKTIKK